MLTDTALRNLKPKGKPYKVADSGVGDGLADHRRRHRLGASPCE